MKKIILLTLGSFLAQNAMAITMPLPKNISTTLRSSIATEFENAAVGMRAKDQSSFLVVNKDGRSQTATLVTGSDGQNAKTFEFKFPGHEFSDNQKISLKDQTIKLHSEDDVKVEHPRVAGAYKDFSKTMDTVYKIKTIDGKTWVTKASEKYSRRRYNREIIYDGKSLTVKSMGRMGSGGTGVIRPRENLVDFNFENSELKAIYADGTVDVYGWADKSCMGRRDGLVFKRSYKTDVSKYLVAEVKPQSRKNIETSRISTDSSGLR